MKKYVFLLLFLALLFSGCVKMRTAEDCENFDAQDALSQATWWQDTLQTDEGVVTKAEITCWHSAALSYAAWVDPMNATDCCERILSLSYAYGDQEMFYREYVLCISAISKRMQMPTVCEKIDDPDFEFEKESCMRNATPPPEICGGALFALLALGASLFFRKQGRREG